MTERITDRIEIVNADCYTLLDAWPSDAALVTDPPYGIAYYHSGGGGDASCLTSPHTARAKAFRGKESMIHGDDKPFDPRPFLAFKTVILWGANHYSCHLPSSPAWFVWDKIVIPESYGKFSFADCEMAWTNGSGPARIYKHLWQGCRRTNDGEIKRFGKLHPNQKPVELMQWCLSMAKVSGDALVIDPFMGSGSLGVACHRAGLRYLGVEIDPEHYATAKARLQRETAQGLLCMPNSLMGG
jgi:site-specific DNA-methyltransferase (adenine-specific)